MHFPSQKKADPLFDDNNDDLPAEDNTTQSTEDDTIEDFFSSTDMAIAEGNFVDITLKSGTRITSRKTQRVIRYVRYNKNTHPEEHFREQILLFHPWRNEEVDLKGSFDTYEEHYLHLQSTILLQKQLYDHKSAEIDDALE